MNFYVVVMDSVGVGYLPDAEKFGDHGANTIGHTAEHAGGLSLPNLAELGIGNLTDISGTAPCLKPRGGYGKLAEKSPGKDTSIGHWELMGVQTEHPFAVYPDGFPPELIADFERLSGYKVIGNKAASGTEIILELGPQQIREKSLIVYTSADSVFQIAAHEDVVAIPELNRIGAIARQVCDKYGVVRVILRPFIGEHPKYVRTSNRKDISVPPGAKTCVEYLAEQGVDIVSIGKISSIFADRGFSGTIKTKNNTHGIEVIQEQITAGVQLDAQNKGHRRFVFANLVDFDSEYGHRRNPSGYAQALQELDQAIPAWLAALGREDVLLLTADHGNDPTWPGTDHTREYIPLLVAGPQIKAGVNLGIRESFADVAETLKDYFQIEAPSFGNSFLAELKA